MNREKWEEQFDRKFSDKFNFNDWLDSDGVSPGQIKHFIRLLLQQERERIIEEMEKQGVIIYKGELPKAIHGLLIDLDKTLNQ